MRRNAVFAFVVHFARADLEFDDLFARADDGRMQAAVGVRFRQGDIIFDTARNRWPCFMDNAEHGVAFGNALSTMMRIATRS